MKHRLYFQLQTARLSVARAAERACRRALGITVVQLGALWVIKGAPDASQRLVAEKLNLNEPAVTGLIGRLTSQGLVLRTRSEADRRRYCLRLSAEGQRLTDAARPLLKQLNETMTEGFTDEELDVVARFLSATTARFTPEHTPE